MKTTNGQIYITKDALQRLVDMEAMPAKYGIKILRMAKMLNNEIGLIEESKNKLIKKYGEEKDGKISVSPKSEKFVDFLKEMNEMMAVEVKLDMEKAQIPDSIAMSIRDLSALEPYIELIEIGGK